jgi:hypothetical protein
MRRLILYAFVAGAACVGSVAAQETKPAAAAAANPPDDAIVKADRAVVGALAKGDKAAANKLLDADFSWVDPEGVMRVKDDAFRAGLKPLINYGDDVKILEHKYGKLVWLQLSQGKNYVAHFWVERPAGWRLLHASEITVRQRDFTPARPTFDVPCVNPCKVVPYVPVTESEKEALAGWQEQESGPAGWDKHIATNYDQRAVNTWVGPRPATKDIIAARNKHLAENPNESKVATVPVLWMRTWDFGDTVVMIACQTTWGDKGYWASRVFAKINGLWQMAESYQNVIQASPILTAVPGANK